MTTSKIKIIFFDIDGTLLKLGEKDLTDTIAMTLNQLQEKGIKLFIATGRPAFVIPHFEKVSFDGIIAYNGQYCFNNDTIIHKQPMDKQDIYHFINNANRMGHVVQAASAIRMGANGYEPDLDEYFSIANQKLNVVNDFDQLLQEDIYQLMIAVKPSEYESLLKGVTQSKITSWWPKAVDVIPKNGGKRVGILKVLDYYGYDISESMAFGDGGNDLEMLETVGIGVAMGNAVDEVKEHSDYVCKSVDEDGIYSACLHFNLIEKIDN